MTDLATKIVTALFDMGEQHGGLIKDRAIERVREIVTAHVADEWPGLDAAELQACNEKWQTYTVPMPSNWQEANVLLGPLSDEVKADIERMKKALYNFGPNPAVMAAKQ